ncbi:MAG: rod shape-determining protein MreC [Lachnospiraceae bacterium]|nr:rod shape-determining protein MreC [Lachnospiraceae bacterium]
MWKRFRKIEISSRQWIIVITIVSLTLMAVSIFTDAIRNPIRQGVSVVVVPMQKGINTIGTYVYSRVEMIANLKNVTEENKELKEKVAQLTEENSLLNQNQIELQRLRELYALDDQYASYEKTAARVIAKESGNWYYVFTIDKGSEDGLEVNMNVIADGGLVGIITEVGPNYAIVRSIIDDNNNVSGMLINSGDTCTVEGSLSLMDDGYVYVKYLNSSVEVKDGDRVVTSNISSKYVEGILIGYIKDVTMDSNNLTKSGYLVPVVDFEHLQEVLIILDQKEIEE